MYRRDEVTCPRTEQLERTTNETTNESMLLLPPMQPALEEVKF